MCSLKRRILGRNHEICAQNRDFYCQWICGCKCRRLKVSVFRRIYPAGTARRTIDSFKSSRTLSGSHVSTVLWLREIEPPVLSACVFVRK